MPVFEAGDAVRVPFPYVETPILEMRPALVISPLALGPNNSLFWAVMITSAANRGWAGDVSVETDHRAFGLPAPSVIRTEKIAVLEADSASLLGKVSEDMLLQVQTRIARYLGLSIGSQ